MGWWWECRIHDNQTPLQIKILHALCIPLGTSYFRASTAEAACKSSDPLTPIRGRGVGCAPKISDKAGFSVLVPNWYVYAVRALV